MKSIVVAGNVKYWEEDTGGKSRVGRLCEHLRKSGFAVSYFMTCDLSDADRRMLDERYPHETLLYVQPTGATSASLMRYAAGNSESMMELNLLDPVFACVYDPRSRTEPIAASNGPEPRLESWYSRHHDIAFKAMCLHTRPDFVIVQRVIYGYLVEGIGKYSANTKTLVDTLDVLYRRYEAFHRNGQPHWLQITEEEEKGCLKHFDVIIAIQEKEASIFRSMVPDKKVITAGHSCPVQPGPENLIDENTVLFVSSQNRPGLKAITLFAQNVWPDVLRASGGKAVLKILGKVCHFIEPGRLGPNIEQLGFVPDLKPFYESAAIVINPADFGGGLKIKNVEALCHGKPLLTTSVGAEGLEAGANRAFLICNTPEEFRKRLVALILDPVQRKELSVQALEFARTRFAPKAAYSELMRVLNPGID